MLLSTLSMNSYLNILGKIVSKKQSLKGKKLYAKYGSKWMSAVSKARKALGIKGFVAIKKARAPMSRK